MKNLPAPVPSPPAPRQPSMPFDSRKLRGMSPTDRATALAQLAGLLLEAAGGAAGEHDDHER